MRGSDEGEGMQDATATIVDSIAIEVKCMTAFYNISHEVKRSDKKRMQKKYQNMRCREVRIGKQSQTNALSPGHHFYPNSNSKAAARQKKAGATHPHVLFVPSVKER
jgi:hypothetical protein